MVVPFAPFCFCRSNSDSTIGDLPVRCRAQNNRIRAVVFSGFLIPPQSGVKTGVAAGYFVYNRGAVKQFVLLQ